MKRKTKPFYIDITVTEQGDVS